MGLKSLLGRIPTILGRRTQTSEDWLDTPTYLRKNSSNDPEVYDVVEGFPDREEVISNDTWKQEHEKYAEMLFKTDGRLFDPNHDVVRFEPQLEELIQEELKMSENEVEKAAPVNTRTQTFERVCASCTQLFGQKNAEYGDTIAATGVLGASVELIGTVARLKKLVLQAPDGGESNVTALVDIFKDLHNYSNIALMMMQEGNWRGK